MAAYKGLSIRNWQKGKFYTSQFRDTAIQYLERMGANTISVVYNSYQSATNTTDIEYTPEGGKWWTDFEEVKEYKYAILDNNK